MRASAPLLIAAVCHYHADAAEAEVPLATFDGAAGTTHKWASHDDPVMGGRSHSTTQVADGALVFDGVCAIVPSLNAPGFITTETRDSFADVSSCSAIKLTVKSATAYAGYRISFGTTHAPGGKFFAHGYKSNFVAPVGQFGDVVIPLTNFTDNWDDASGNPIKTCQENPIFCPDKKTLQNMGTMSIWAEGVEGKVHLEVKYIGGVGCGTSEAIAAAANGVALSTFDGAKATTQSWKELNDPVMGGRSTGTFAIEQGVGVFNGSVVDVPSLKAPGFIKVQGKGVVPDASGAAGGALVLSVRSSTPGYKGFRVSFASGTVSPDFACAGGGSLPLSRGCFKAKFSVAAGKEFSQVRIPFSSFSDKWSPATGEQTTTCAEDASVCPTAEKLAKIQDIEFWAEGALGAVHLEIQSVSAEQPAAAVAASAQSVELATFGGAADKTWHAECDPVMGGQSVAGFVRNSTFGEFSGEVKIVPSLKAPGFCIALTSSPLTAKFADASPFDGLALGLVNRGAVTAFKAAFCSSRLGFTCQFQSFKADFTAAAGTSEAFIPWAQFSNKWSSTTGEPTSQSPPTAADLKGITQLQLWVEGLAGKFDVELKYVRARKA